MLDIAGVVAALVTPLDEDGNLKEQSMRDVIDWVINGGVHGVFALGSAGEIYGLRPEQKRRVLELTVEHVNGRVPIYAGASEITTPDCLATVKMAHEVGGVDAFSVLTPYFLTPSQSELVTHFRSIAQSTDLPVLLYSNPNRTKVPITPATAEALAGEPNIVGIKDSAGDIALTAEYLRRCPHYKVLIGLDSVILPGLMMGAHGAIASTANVAPALVAGVYNAYMAGDIDKAKELQGALADLRSFVNVATFPLVIKEGLKYLGVDAGYCVAPAREMPEGTMERLRTVVDAAMAATR